MDRARHNPRTRIGTGRRVLPTLALLGALGLALGSCKPGGPTDPGDGGPDPNPGGETFSVTLEWNAPTQDAEGAPLLDLAGYTVHYRPSSPADGPGATSVDAGEATRVTIDELPAGAWHFGVTARDVSGNESALSNELRIEVGP